MSWPLRWHSDASCAFFLSLLSVIAETRYPFFPTSPFTRLNRRQANGYLDTLLVCLCTISRLSRLAKSFMVIAPGYSVLKHKQILWYNQPGPSLLLILIKEVTICSCSR